MKLNMKIITSLISLSFVCILNGHIHAQNRCLSDSDYMIYNYLVNQYINNDTTTLKQFKIYINDSTKEAYNFSEEDTTNLIPYRVYENLYLINRKKCLIDTNRMNVVSLKRRLKGNSNAGISFEFGKCYFFNNMYVAVYFSIDSVTGGAGYIYVLEKDGEDWKTIKKVLQAAY